MDSISWASVVFYCLFSNFVYYQQLHAKEFRGASPTFGFFLSLFAFAGMATGLVFLIYYGWKVVWWAPFIIFIIGILFTIIGVLIEKVIGKFAMSLIGFIGWPICAYFMFRYIPKII